MEVQMNQNYKKNYKKSSNQNNEEKKKVTVKGSSKSYMKKPDPNVIKKKDPKSATSTEKETSRYKATKEEVDQIRESVTHTVPVKRKKKMNPKDVQILLGLFVIAAIVSWFTLGPVVTIILALGILLIIGIAALLKKFGKKGKRRTVLNVVLIVFLSFCILGALAVGGFMLYIVNTAPEFDPNALKNQQSSILYDRDGNEMTKLGAEVREDVTYDQLPQVFVDALIAIEDSRFFQHNGFDAARFLVASLKQVTGQGGGGASTLSMQVVKNTYTDATATTGIQGIIRKFTDIYLAVFKLEKNYSKEQIIEFYVNSQCFNGTVCGVEQASQMYFDKSVSDLNLAEASLLAGMFQAPSSYNPYNNPDRASERRDDVLDMMIRHGYITESEADAARMIPVSSLLSDNGAQTMKNQAFIDTVLEELEDKYNINPYNVSVEVYTTMDQAKQDGVDDIFNGTTFTWENEVVQGAAAAIDIHTGEILAIGAGRNRSGIRSLNYATQVFNQIGSTAKPIFDYAPGMEYLNWSTYTQFVDEPWSYSSGQAINNSDRKFMGQISIRTALAQSRNIPALKAFQTLNQEIGNQKIYDFVTSLGITPETTSGDTYVHEAHSLGAFNGASVLQMAGAYAAFGNGGYYNEPYSVRKVVYRDTGEVIEHESTRNQVMSDSTAFMITDCLRSAVTEGISSGANISGVNVAAKTGTTNFDAATKEYYHLPSNAVKDAWIVGYDPDIALAMWYGYELIDSHYVSTNASAVKWRTRLYQALGNVVYDRTGKDFTAPSSVVRVGIEAGSNPAQLPSENTPADQIVYEYFKAGTEPTETSTRYVKLPTPTGLKVTYEDGKVTISWNRTATQTGNESYGSYGYRVYYNNTELGFTTENTYSFETSEPYGTYSVVSSFENYTANQSSATSYTLEDETEENITSSLKGRSSYTCSVGSCNVTEGVTILDGTRDITSTVAAQGGIATQYIYIDSTGTQDTTKTAFDDSLAGSWVIKYIINYHGYTRTHDITIEVR